MYSRRFFLLFTAFLQACAWDYKVDDERSLGFVPGTWTLTKEGTSGVSAMQLAVVSETTAIILDKVEHNPLNINGHPAWASEFNLVTKKIRPLNPLSNTWCATGSFLGNGTLVSSAGNPVVITGQDGLQAIRLFTPCSDGKCDIFEDQNTMRMATDRWYPSSVRIEDGSVLIYGGSKIGGFINNSTANNPTYEFYPPKNIHGYNGIQIPSQFMIDTLNANNFPIMIYLPDGNIFIAANQQAMIFNWRTNTETRLPGIPNGVRITSPFSAGAVLLPLTPENDYIPEVMICGGSTMPDNLTSEPHRAHAPASSQCSRMVLTPAGIAAGWKVEHMPQTRVMPEMVQLPDMRILIVNGAQAGMAGYGFTPDRVGESDATNPAFRPVIYDPTAPEGQRFSSIGIPASDIARVYHSTATLTPNGTILIAGSNPNDDRTTGVPYPTEYRLESYSPPYMTQPRPSYSGLPITVDYNHVFELKVDLPKHATHPNVIIMDLGFATHGVHMDQRVVKLKSTLSADRCTLIVTGPPSSKHYPPGPAFLYVVTNNGVPSFGHKTLIGTGASPPVDLDAIANLLRSTSSNW